MSPRTLLSAFTDPESFGHPVPANVKLVILGGTGGAARARAGSNEKKSDERMVNALLGGSVR